MPGKVVTQHDQPFLVALARAFYWQLLLDDGVVGSGSEIARREVMWPGLMLDAGAQGLCRRDHPSHVTVAHGTLAHQQQVAGPDGPAEIGNI